MPSKKIDGSVLKYKIVKEDGKVYKEYTMSSSLKFRLEIHPEILENEILTVILSTLKGKETKK